MPNDRWYAAQVMTGKESDIAADLREGGINASAPRRMMLERRLGQWHEIVRTLFPGYVFARCEMDAAAYYRITRTPGVIRLLGKDNGVLPEPIPDEQMHAVMVLMGCESAALSLSFGTMRRDGTPDIRVGPLAPLADKIVRYDRHRRRATIEIDLMNEKKRIDLTLITDDRYSQAPHDGAPRRPATEEQTGTQ